MKKLLFSLIFASLALRAFGQTTGEKIDGAFGLKFGDVFDPVSIAATAISNENGEVMYRFKPKTPMAPFNGYSVLITPKTRRIAAIFGLAIFGDENRAQKEQIVVSELLAKKYGYAFPEKRADSLPESTRISQGTRGVMVQVTGDQLTILYCDNLLKDIAEAERLELDAQKIASTNRE